MTIILQYQFWDLKVEESFFEVGLHFKNVPERLHVPFDAVSGFYDPSVQFGLKFEAQGEEGDEFDEEDEESIVGPVANPQRPVEVGRPKPRGAGSEPDIVPAKGGAPSRAPKPAAAFKEPAAAVKEPAAAVKDKGAGQPAAAKTEPEAKASAKEESTDESKVVSIDAFRKKP